MYNLIISVVAVLLCVAVLNFLKYFFISKMRIDDRDQKKKPKLSTYEVLTLLRDLKPFPISVHKGWKLHSFRHNSRVWCQEISVNSKSSSVDVYAAYTKTKIPAQLVLQILKDISKTSSWKPGCLATSITSRPMESEAGIRTKSTMGNLPVQHDIVIEETSPDTTHSYGIWSLISHENRSLQTVQKEHRRYWHREDNGVCWHLQMCESHQEWLFFLAQPVEDVEECLLTVLGYQDRENRITTASYVSEALSSFTEYIQYRKLAATPLVEIKLPSPRSEKVLRSYSSSEDVTSPGRKMFLRFRSLVEKPSFGADKLYSPKQQIIRSASILKHNSPTFSNGLDINKSVSDTLKTSSLDRRKDMPKLATIKDANVNNNEDDDISGNSASNKTVIDARHADMEERKNEINSSSSGSAVFQEAQSVSDSSASETGGGRVDVEKERKEDIDRILDADINAEEEFEKSTENLLKSTDSKEDIYHIVQANQTAAELLAVALQASNIDLSKSVHDQVVNSGGWIYLGKGIIQADPRAVWNAIKNPRTKFTYDDSLKKVDVLEKVSDSIKIVYYYHEVLQLFKTECCDMIVMQSERVDSGEKYILAFQSTERSGVTLPENTTRVKVLPSGWILEPVSKEKKIFTMVTYIMQIDFGDMPLRADKSPFEDLISKQPMSIAYLRQYLRGCVYHK
ncbi:uncharacterized protein LOC123542672 isoform X2 [Mercenaria mercenaria]|uniref:uncharacterized protein LOC123542672 isoform X2 n=1 Tax=Mercenaria mercenaria TaxID=6596 RepID=UPI00234F5311|nr:uncharacterized protein LOC123542672 isoform X2 [Mercenaria mercenaria]